MRHLIIDCTTGEEVSVPLTKKELADQQAAAADHAVVTAAAEAKAAARQAALEGITAHAQANPEDAVALLARALGLL